MLFYATTRSSIQRFKVLIGRNLSSSPLSVATEFLHDNLRSTVKKNIIQKITKDDCKLWGIPECDMNDKYVSRYNVKEVLADPFELSAPLLERLNTSIRNDLIGTDHPVLQKAASYFFSDVESGKKVRPMIILLLSRALKNNSAIEARQYRLAQISEMIHTASLFHDDVIDGSVTRRGKPSVHTVFGNKMAILAGDYLLARASIALARLRDVDVVEIMSTIIEHLVKGEVMQLQVPPTYEHNSMLQYYLRKNFYKTASLMANSCKSAAILASVPPNIIQLSYDYGKHIGLAYQLVDDLLDFSLDSATLGKPSLNDLQAGIATAPVLFAAQIYPDVILPLIQRKFRHEGDTEIVLKYIRKTDALSKTKQLAQVHADLAIDAISTIKGDCIYKESLIRLAFHVVERTR